MRKCYEEQKELFTAIMSVQMPERPGGLRPSGLSWLPV